MADHTEVTKRADAAVVAKTFHVELDGTLPVALANAIVELARLAHEMAPDDISVSLDLPSGTLSFRAYRRASPAT